MRVVAERAGRALGLPHRRRLRRVTRHRVAGAGAVLRGHLPVFHDLLDLGSFVLKPDFHLGGGTKAHVTGTLRGCPRASPRVATGGDFGPQKARPWRLPAALGPRSRGWAGVKACISGPRGRPVGCCWGRTPRLLSFVGAGGGGASVRGRERSRVGLRGAPAKRRHERLQNNRQGPVS